MKFDTQVDDRTITQSTLLHDDIPGYDLLTLEFVLPPEDDNKDLILKEESMEIYAHLENVLVHMIDAQDFSNLKKTMSKINRNFQNTYDTHKCGKSCLSISPIWPLHATFFL